MEGSEVYKSKANSKSKKKDYHRGHRDRNAEDAEKERAQSGVTVARCGKRRSGQMDLRLKAQRVKREKKRITTEVAEVRRGSGELGGAKEEGKG